MSIEVLAPLKVNLSLHIWKRLPDGYHYLVSHFHSIKVFESLKIEIRKGGRGEFSFKDVTGFSPEGKDNLLYKGYLWWQKMFSEYGSDKVEVILEKKVPPGTGLGSGSSDVSALLYGLCKYYGVSEENLYSELKTLGADVSFTFLAVKKWNEEGKRLQALVSGIGDRMKEISPLEGEFVVFYPPDFSISTKEAYQKIDQLKDYENEEEVEYPYGKNDFELILPDDFRSNLKELKEKMEELGAEFTLLSGSGSSVVAYFPQEAPKNIKFKDWKVIREDAAL